MPVQDTQFKIDKYKLMVFTENVFPIIRSVRLTFIRYPLLQSKARFSRLDVIYVSFNIVKLHLSYWTETTSLTTTVNIE